MESTTTDKHHPGRGKAFPPDDVSAELRHALRLEGELPPSDEKTLVLSRVVTGYLRTTPLALAAPDLAREHAIAAFAAAYPRWWQLGDAPYVLVGALLDDVFHQRALPTPPAPAIDVLQRIAVGILRRKRARPTHAAQLAIADWFASLFLAGSLE